MYVEQVRRSIWWVTSGIPAFLPASLEDAEQVVVGIDRRSARGGKDKRVLAVVVAGGSPPFELRVDRYRKPDAGVAALRLGFHFDAVSDAGVDSKAVLPLVIPPERKEFAGPKPEDKKHANDQPVAFAEIEQNDPESVRA